MKEDNIFEFSFEPLKAQWNQQAVNVIVAANIDSSPLIVSGFVKPQQFKKQTYQLLEKTLAAQQKSNKQLKSHTQFNHVLRYNGQIVAVMLSMDYVIYFNNISHLLETDSYYKLYKNLTIEDMAIGERVYFTRLSVKPSWMGKGLGKKMFYQIVKYLKGKGYEGSYSGLVSLVSQKIFAGLGGQLQISQEVETGSTNFTSKIFYNCFSNVIERFESAAAK